jgi:hypothetical protein
MRLDGPVQGLGEVRQTFPWPEPQCRRCDDVAGVVPLTAFSFWPEPSGWKIVQPMQFDVG